LANPGYTRHAKEQAFWDALTPTVEKARSRYLAYCQHGVEPNLDMAIRWLGPLEGRRILDFACGNGTLSCYLASRGAHVTGVDISESSIGVATQIAASAALPAEFSAADLFDLELPSDHYDAVIGSFALHHVEVRRFAPELARILRPGAPAAFLETIGLNPILMAARRHLVGHLGIPRWGTPDERPLHQPELEAIRAAFGSMTLDQADYRFLSMIEVQWLAGRTPRIGQLLRAVDETLSRVGPLARMGYHQVLLCRRTV
jgi:SAM-dependent methyltransferase